MAKAIKRNFKGGSGDISALGGFSFFNNPEVVYINSDNSPYEDDNGNYILADSDTGRELLLNTAYSVNIVEGNFYRIEGADSVNPFKGKVNLAELTVANATAADITEGKIAWVNGELITGTRPAPLKSLSGTISIGIPEHSADYKVVVNFDPPFDTVPTVTYNATSGDRYYCTGVNSITRTSCIFHFYSDRGSTKSVTVNWTATA